MKTLNITYYTLKAGAMVEDIRKSFKELVTESQWMDSETQVRHNSEIFKYRTR